MGKTEEKLSKFSYTVMKEAEEKKKKIVLDAEKVRKDAIEANEIRCLKKAYERIQEGLHQLEKEKNEVISKAVVESKQTLFNRREEIIKAIFSHVTEKLAAFRRRDEYKNYMESTIKSGLLQAGEGELCLYADSEDISVIEEIRAKSDIFFRISESESELLGGCLIVNKTKGFVCDYSFASSLKGERAAFLENYGISIE